MGANAVAPFELVVEEWETWKLMHGKSYGRNLLGDAIKDSHMPGGGYGQEEKFRMKIWMENKAKIEKHNRHALKGMHSYHLAMNEWGDLLHHEFVATVNGYKARPANFSGEKPQGAKYLLPAHTETLPDNVDWRDHGAVTPVKNQGQCGSCWSFSTTGALEAMHHRATGKLTSLSEQNLIDCSRKYGNQGCNGGLMDAAFQYIKDNGGIDTEKSYPYEGEDDTCRYDPHYKGARDVGFVDVEQGNEHALKTALATQGPCSRLRRGRGHRLRLLAGEEQLGHHLGPRRLCEDRQERGQHVRRRLLRQLSSCLNTIAYPVFHPESLVLRSLCECSSVTVNI